MHLVAPSVVHLPQDQTMGRGGHAGAAPIFSSQHFLHAIRFELPTSNLDQRSHDSTAHLVKKSIALQDEGEQRTSPADIASCQSPDRALRLVGAGAGEGCKVAR